MVLGIWPKFMCAYIASWFVQLFYVVIDKNKVKEIQDNNTEMDKIRREPIKDLDAQKKFLDLKYPKTQFKWSWGVALFILKRIIVLIPVYLGVQYLFSYVGINFGLFGFLLGMTVWNIATNLILKKFNLQGDDMTVFFR